MVAHETPISKHPSNTAFVTMGSKIKPVDRFKFGTFFSLASTTNRLKPACARSPFEGPTDVEEDAISANGNIHGSLERK